MKWFNWGEAEPVHSVCKTFSRTHWNKNRPNINFMTLAVSLIKYNVTLCLVWMSGILQGRAEVGITLLIQITFPTLKTRSYYTQPIGNSVISSLGKKCNPAPNVRAGWEMSVAGVIKKWLPCQDNFINLLIHAVSTNVLRFVCLFKLKSIVCCQHPKMLILRFRWIQEDIYSAE